MKDRWEGCRQQFPQNLTLRRVSGMDGQSRSTTDESTGEATSCELSSMQKGITGQAELVRQSIGVLSDDLNRVLPREQPTKIYLVGCGDSYYSGLASKYAVAAWARLPVEAVESLEFSRYAIHFAPSDALVVAVSNSGEVSRTVECVRYARQRGLTTLGITSRHDSRLAQEAESVLTYSYPNFGLAPGTSSYVASVLALLVTGLRLSELGSDAGRSPLREALRTLQDLGDVIEATIEMNVEEVERMTPVLGDDTRMFFLGSGPNYGTALFSAAKMIESSGHNSVGQDLEEWAHEQYFCTGPGTVVVVIAPPGASIDRAREVLGAIREIGGIAAVVCDVDDHDTRDLGDFVFPVTGPVSERLSPLPYCVAGELIAYHYASRNQKVMFGFDDPLRKAVNMRQIYRSTIPSSPPHSL